MLEYYPDARGANYWPNHMFTMLVNCGLTVGDAAEALGPSLAEAQAGRDAGTPEFQARLVAGVLASAERLERLSAEDAAYGRRQSASDKAFRAAVLLEQADWQFWPWGSADPARPGDMFRRARAAFRQGVDLAADTGASDGARWTQVPFEGQLLDALFVPAKHAAPAPVVIHLNGQHSSFHWHYQSGLPRLLAERGIASLLFDHPGVGSARHDLGLKVRADTESYTGAAIDHLAGMADADAARVGVIGGSLGGYRAPRAAAFEPRIRAAVAWGAHYDMYDSIRIDYPALAPKLPAGGPFTQAEETIVAGLHYWAGTNTVTQLDALIRSLSLDGVMSHVRCPLLVVHGSNDQQLPIWHAERTVAEAVNSPRAELLVVGPDTGGDQHCNWDNPAFALHAMCDWMVEALAG